MPNHPDQTVGHKLREDVADSKGDVLAEAGVRIDKDLAAKLARFKSMETIPVTPYVGDETTYMSADTEDKRG